VALSNAETGAVEQVFDCNLNDAETRRLAQDEHVTWVCTDLSAVFRVDHRERHRKCQNWETCPCLMVRDRADFLYSVAYDRVRNEILTGGADSDVAVYDCRMLRAGEGNIVTEPSRVITNMQDDNGAEYVTGLTLSDDCESLLVARGGMDACVDLFATRSGELKSQYQGHISESTVKAARFGGLNEELILSGSDCGNAFVWDRATGALRAWFQGDEEICNCVVMPPTGELQIATSGLADTVSIALPVADTDMLPESRRFIKRNLTLHLAQMEHVRQQQCPVQ
jgi:WD40 repeat protein